MRLSVNTWRKLNIIIAVWILSLAIIIDVCSGKNMIILSCCSLLVCLIVCKEAMPKATGWDELVTEPIIRETALSIDIGMDIPGVTLEDVERAQRELENWKKGNNFTFKHPDTVLEVYFTDTQKNGMHVNKIGDIKEPNWTEYIGVLSYYMQNGERRFKCDDIQLGCLDVSILNNLDNVLHKKCHILIDESHVSHRRLVECVVLS